MLEYKMKEWGYRTLPNKMYELVKNSGDMHNTGTGYFTDAESEMITILEYLNNGVKTNITESMIEQIEKAINDSLSLTLESETGYTYKATPGMSFGKSDANLSLSNFVGILTQTAKIDVCVIRYSDEGFTTQTYSFDGRRHLHNRENIRACREFAWSKGFRVKYSKNSSDTSDILEIWI